MELKALTYLVVGASFALYIGIARANQAWLSYHAGELEQTAKLARQALRQWGKLVFPFHWLACWPLLAVSLAQADLDSAIIQAKTMLAPEQQQPLDELFAALSAAIRCYPDDVEQSKVSLNQAVQLARQKHLL